MPLTTTERQQFQNLGYLVKENIYSRQDLQPLKDGLTQVIDDTCATLQDEGLLGAETFAEAPFETRLGQFFKLDEALGDRIIGTAFPDGPVPEEWADAAADLPLVSDRVPGEEAVLELEPDFIYAGWESNFSADGVGERDELAALGIDTYVSPAACRSAEVPDELDFEEVFREIAEVASIFDVDASELIEAQRAELDAIVPDSRGLTALWYSSGSDTPYVGAGSGAPQMVLDAIGLRNIAGDIEGGWTSLSWESVIEADPSVIVLVESDWGSAEKKIAQLEGNPATAQLTAVLGERYLIVPFAASEAGVRSVSAASDLSAQLASLTAP